MNVLVIGAGKSGISAAKLAAAKGNKVFLTELNDAALYSEEIDILKKNNVKYEFGKNSIDNLKQYDFIITSPGVPPDSPIISTAWKQNVEIISEVEFAFRYLNNPIVAITGTNGKTTTTALTEFIFNNSGRKAVACGNIGKPMTELVDNIDSDTIIIAELSSYQLDKIYKFKPDVAILLNLTPDHLKYHGSIEKYYKAKFKITKNQTSDNFVIINYDDENIKNYEFNTKAKILKFSDKHVDWGIYCDGAHLKFIDEKHEEEELMLSSELSLPGIHNRYNSMAAALAARAFEITNEDIRDSLMKFRGVEHRLEYVRTIDGIEFVNDSKATNINATWYALISYKKPIIWIAGGRGDSNDYSILNDAVEKNVKSIVSIGEESDAIFNHFCTSKRCIKSHSLQEVVETAFNEAEAGDIVLFTPACKSFDMFANFEHRGEEFKKFVNQL
jgi:UDP-N-acetylmuramoylalanine--D-glutamate ligase